MKILIILLAISSADLFDGRKPQPVVKRSEVGRHIKRDYRKLNRSQMREIRKINRKSVPLKGAYIPEGYYT
tara:strand:- start:1714 stop:1926 length:213 start_codon:yes stop_codon:yes gene_type:complete